MVYIPDDLREQVITRGKLRCEYCGAPLVIVITREIDHIVPVSKGGQTTSDNLCLTCEPCNGAKRDHETGRDPESGNEHRLFHPRLDRWHDHFAWREGGTVIVGLTAIGRATVERLAINRPAIVEARRYWIIAGWYPPQEE
jgi:hypothetical protein